MSRLIGGCAGTRYGCCNDGKTSKVDATGSNCAAAAKPVHHYNQLLSGDVTVKKVSSQDSTHKITFSKKNIGKVVQYQVWSDSSVVLDNTINLIELDAIEWVSNTFHKVETGPSNSDCFCSAVYDPVICGNGTTYSNSCNARCAGQTNCKPSSPMISIYTPTTIMESCGLKHRHMFVIKRALVNKSGQVVFYVSSKDIVLPSNPSRELKRLKTIPTGSYRDVKFTIDNWVDM
jgi:hypothetical protein